MDNNAPYKHSLEEAEDMRETSSLGFITLLELYPPCR